MFFFWKRFMMIFLEKNINGTQNGTHNCYFEYEVVKSHFWKLDIQQNSRIRKILSKCLLMTVDTVLESWNIILLDSKTLGTTLGTMRYYIKPKKLNFCVFYTFCIIILNENFTLWGTIMVPKNILIGKYESSAF